MQDAEAFRVLIKRMLEHNHASPADLLRKWGGGKKGLDLKQFTSHVYESFFANEDVTPEDLWVTEVAVAVDESFRNMLNTVRGSEGGSNLLQKVGIVHLQRCKRWPSALMVDSRRLGDAQPGSSCRLS